MDGATSCQLFIFLKVKLYPPIVEKRLKRKPTREKRWPLFLGFRNNFQVSFFVFRLGELLCSLSVLVALLIVALASVDSVLCRVSFASEENPP
ncbi:hypothetical protein Peur_073300 [Populus x canadensis]